MQTSLPSNALVKSFRSGDIPVSDLEIGDQVLGYDIREKNVVVMKITGKTALPEQPVLSVFLQSFRWCYFFLGTQANTTRGLALLSSQPPLFITYCVVNPMRLTSRTAIEYAEVSPMEGVMLEWEGGNLLWSEGLLVGS